jgi:putative acyl-CoA dehydrogenase
LESEAATALSLRLARAFDSEHPREIALRRALTSGAKFWVCKRGCELAAEAMEVLGGNGYTEELPLARLAREMPVNSIWEGSGNIMCLDVLRAFAKHVGTREAVLDEMSGALGHIREFDAAFERFASETGVGATSENHARRFVQSFVTLLQAKLLIAAAAGPASRAVAEGFCATRLGPGGWGAVFGATEAQLDHAAILGRAWNQD